MTGVLIQLQNGVEMPIQFVSHTLFGLLAQTASGPCYTNQGLTKLSGFESEEMDEEEMEELSLPKGPSVGRVSMSSYSTLIVHRTN
jgi:hypothetical protein